ncbi:MAG: hypothetical protein BGO43_02150 [Gammaproteobacteria bacterium 39-13]|nr:hypothetical protein [Gammaproteobacteria bacterium]OJV87354.1 MAG: hypothetical protein BGO43_02150 [Gammaproteobacteria bacterium 39-13]
MLNSLKAKVLFSLLCISVLGSASVCADEPQETQAKVQQGEKAPTTVPDETEFFATVNETGGYITKELHYAFWERMKQKYDEEQRKKIVDDIQNTLNVLKDFQAQTWKSAKESYFAKKIEKDKDYFTLKDKLEKHKSQYFSPQVIIENSEKIITASATRSSLDLGAGKFYITPELIEENLIGIKGSYERLKILLTPEWKEEYREYLLPKINVSLLSLYAPDEYHELIQHTDEKIDIDIAQLCVDKNAIYELGAVDYQKADKKFVNFTPEEKEIYIQEFVKEQFAGYKINEPLLSKGSWRGYEYAKGIASLDNYNIVIMSMFVADKAFYIKFVTNQNLSSAGTDFNEFTKRIQILEKT